MPVAVKKDAREAFKAKAESLFEKYMEPVLLELSLSYTHIVPLLDFGLVQSILNFLQVRW